MDPRGELMFLQRNYARTVCAFYRYIKTFRCVKGMTHSPILVRALLLHLYRLLQFTVGGAEVVVPLHVGASCLAAWVASAQVGPERLRLKRAAFPRCHFNCGAGQAGRGVGEAHPIAEGRWVRTDGAVGSITSLCALTSDRREKLARTVHFADVSA